MNKKDTKSRRITPWTNETGATPLQRLIIDCTERDYQHRHPDLKDIDEAGFVNSKEQTVCRYCGSNAITREGFSSTGIRRYRCKECGRRFTALTNTIFDSHRLPMSEWMGFFLDIIGYGSFSLTSKVNRNSTSTTKYWMDKTFRILEGIQDDIILEDRVWLDETYFKVRAPEVQRKGDGKEYRGLSRNQMCIGVACDGKHSVILFEGYGTPSSGLTCSLFSSHIAKGSTLVHDKDAAHARLVSELSLTSEAYDSRELKKLPDSKNPLGPVNRICFLLQTFLSSHSGFDRDDIQGYLNLFHVIVNEPENKYEKLEILLNRAIDFPVLLRYRR